MADLVLIRKRIKGRLGMNVAQTNFDSDVDEQIQGAQESFETEGVQGELPWFLDIENIVPCNHIGPTPDNLRVTATGWIEFIRLREINPVRVQVGGVTMPDLTVLPQWQTLAGRPLSEFDSLSDGVPTITATAPTHYRVARDIASENMTIIVWPIPASLVLNYSIRGFKKAAVLTADPGGPVLENEWTRKTPKLLEARAGLEYAQIRGHAGALQYYQALLQATTDACIRAHNAFYEAALQDDALDDQTQ